MDEVLKTLVLQLAAKRWNNYNIIFGQSAILHWTWIKPPKSCSLAFCLTEALIPC